MRVLRLNDPYAEGRLRPLIAVSARTLDRPRHRTAAGASAHAQAHLRAVVHGPTRGGALTPATDHGARLTRDHQPLRPPRHRRARRRAPPPRTTRSRPAHPQPRAPTRPRRESMTPGNPLGDDPYLTVYEVAEPSDRRRGGRRRDCSVIRARETETLRKEGRGPRHRAPVGEPPLGSGASDYANSDRLKGAAIRPTRGRIPGRRTGRRPPAARRRYLR